MTYIITTFNGKVYEISEQDYKNLDGKTGLVYFSSIDLTLNLSSISMIERSDNVKKPAVDRLKQNEAILHDGTRVIKQFGQWFCADGSRNEQGMLETTIDPEYYPEINSGILPTPQEYEEKFKMIPSGSWVDELLRLKSADPENPISIGERSSESGLTKI